MVFVGFLFFLVNSNSFGLFLNKDNLNTLHHTVRISYSLNPSKWKVKTDESKMMYINHSPDFKIVA